VLLRPGLHEAGGDGRRIADGLPADFESSSLMFPPIVSTGAPGLRHGARRQRLQEGAERELLFLLARACRQALLR